MKLKPATWAWVGLVCYVTAADAVLIAAEARGVDGYCTMSTAFKTALEHPAKRWQLILSWLLVTLHLFPIVLPKSWRPYEPIGFSGRIISGLVTGRTRPRAACSCAGPGSERYL